MYARTEYVLSNAQFSCPLANETQRVSLFRKRFIGICTCTAIIFLTGRPATTETVDTLMVKGSGYTRESAIAYTGETAVTRAIERYVRPAALESNRDQIRFRILDESSGYLKSLKIIKSYIDDEGVHQITAEAKVSIDRLLTSLRNLNVEVRMWAPGPDQAIEGRRGAGRRTGRDRFKDDPLPD